MLKVTVILGEERKGGGRREEGGRCVSSPCLNGGTCNDAVNKYSCTCAAGWSGPACAAEVDKCVGAENDCDKSRSRCIHVGVKKHECICNPGYETNDGGKKCANINECSSTPCMNGATCNDGQCKAAACVVQYSCTCSKGWAGTHC